MGQAAHDTGAEGAMDIADQRHTFSAFMHATVWGSALVAMCVAGLTVAFAVGAGWFAGLAVYAVIGLVAGLLLRMGGAWWATLIISTVVLAIGGAVTIGIAGLVG